jgi:hypothetical protein
VVTLSGIAKNDAEKSLVTKLVTDINGVTSVINNMTIAVPVAANYGNSTGRRFCVIHHRGGLAQYHLGQKTGTGSNSQPKN